MFKINRNCHKHNKFLSNHCYGSICTVTIEFSLEMFMTVSIKVYKDVV